MEFVFDLREVLPDAVTCISGSQLPLQKGDERGVRLAAIINKIGAASAKAQGLRAAVTTCQKFMASSHTLYLLRDDGSVHEEKPVIIGLLKVGKKKLFLTDPQGVLREVEPLCVLDFYIHETRQRAGHGRRLFQTMLNTEGVKAADLAIDRPSTKFLAFLKKHYRLHCDIKQGNNFVVFSQFFQNANLSSRPSRKLEETQTSPHHLSSLTTSPLRPTHTLPRNTSSAVSEDDRGKSLTSPSSHNCKNFKWSPNTVLMGTRHIQHTPYNIITGGPLLTSRWNQHLQTQRDGKEGEGNAPLLTMREKRRHLKGSSRLGFLSSSRVSTTIPEGCHLAGRTCGPGIRPDSAYSRHSLKPMQPSSHTLIQPDQNQLNSSSMEQRSNNWKPI